MSLVDFFHVDSMEIINYEPIYRHFPNSVMVAVPRSEWLDFDRAVAYFQERRIAFQTSPSIDPACVITTQYHKEIELPEYKKSLTMRLMYGIAEKPFGYDRKTNEPFDAVLVPGQYYKDIISNYTNAIIVGFPKYDDFFKGLYRKQDLQKEFKLDNAKKTILYLPTWAEHSSIDLYKNAIKKLTSTNKYNVIFKPHTVTVRRERYRIDYFHREIDEGRIICLEQQIGLDKLFSVADIVIADAISGASWESLLIANLPTLVIHDKGNFQKEKLKTQIHEFAVVNNNPSLLMEELKRVENEPSEFKERRKEWIDKLISFRDGIAGKRAADEICNFIELKRREKRIFDFVTTYPHAYLAKTGYLRRFSYTQFKKKIKKIFPILSMRLNYTYRYFQKITNLLKDINCKNSYEKTINWLKNNQVRNGGIVISSKRKIPYLEVTGYTIPTLYQWGEKKLARNLTVWLIDQQNSDGSFSAPDGTPYTFDTGQVIRSFVAALDDLPEVEKPLRKACDWILTQVQSDGRLATPSTEMWGNVADDRIHLYVLQPLIEAGKKLHEPKYIESALRVLRHYKRQKGLIEFNTLSHFFAYIIEALCDLGEMELARKGMAGITALQRRDGSVPAYKRVSWVCLPGLAQFAVIWYKLGMREYADKAMHYLEKAQNRGGGFYGSSGKGAKYFSREEVSWAVKFFLDAHYWKVKTTFNQKINIFPEYVDNDDGRVKEILSFFGDLSGKRVIDIGCGKGRFLRVLKSKFPNTQFCGLDISEKMLSSCPKEVEAICGSMLDIRYPEAYFDYVYCIEALEHALRIEDAVKEMVRILKPRGKIIIIDKNIAQLGKLKIEPWEQWFKPKEIVNLLQNYGVEARYKPIAYGKCFRPNGLFMAWEGIKNA